MNTQFRKGIIEMCVIALIDKNDMYGYEIVQSLAEFTDINEGTIYPILRRITKEGYFTTYLKESSSGPARKYYRITPLGKIFLDDLKKEWQDTSIMVDKIISQNIT
ncbi:MAG: PadR family transcriptional regulator [Oscillospiraceae bacterium]